MSYHDKFIIPLLNSNLAKEDLDKSTGFIGLYSEYTKRPSLQNHIFLLYKKTINTKNFSKTDKKISSLNNHFATINEFGKDGTYKLYIITITNKTIFRILTSFFTLSADEKMRIMTFWNLEDDDINEYICNSLSMLKHKYITQYINDIKETGASL